MGVQNSQSVEYDEIRTKLLNIRKNLLGERHHFSPTEGVLPNLLQSSHIPKGHLVMESVERLPSTVRRCKQLLL